MTAEVASDTLSIGREIKMARRRRRLMFFRRLFAHPSFLVGFVIYAAVKVLHYFSEDTVTGTGIQKLSFLLLVGLVVYAAVTGAS